MSIAVKSGLPSLGSTEGAVISADEVSVSEDGSAAASVGEDLPRGKSAYEIAKENGFSGTEAEWLASLKGEPGSPGAKGNKGDPGATPNLTIGSVTTLDAGQNATAIITGESPDLTLNLGIPKGADGQPGADGKTAYQYAQDGGYTRTETEFATKLAQEQLTGTTDELTPTQVY